MTNALAFFNKALTAKNIQIKPGDIFIKNALVFHKSCTKTG